VLFADSYKNLKMVRSYLLILTVVVKKQLWNCIWHM